MALTFLLASTLKSEVPAMWTQTQSLWAEGPLSQEFSETHPNLKIGHMCPRRTKPDRTITESTDTVSRTLMASTSIRAKNDGSINPVIIMAFNKCSVLFSENRLLGPTAVSRRLCRLWYVIFFSRDLANFVPSTKDSPVEIGLSNVRLLKHL